MSLRIADAVSIEPAPTPTTVTSSDKSVLKLITFDFEPVILKHFRINN